MEQNQPFTPEQLHIVLTHEANRLRRLNNHPFAVYSGAIWLRQDRKDYMVASATIMGTLVTMYDEKAWFAQPSQTQYPAITDYDPVEADAREEA